MAARGTQVRKAPEAALPTLRKASSKEHVEVPAASRVAAADAPMKIAKVMKALPVRKALVAMKAAPKKKVASRVMKAVVPKGKAKAVAAKEFAAVASKLKKTKSKEALAGTGTWYFMSDLRKMKVGADDSKAWTKYSPRMNKQLESAYSKGFKQYTMKFKDKTYVVKFKSMMQFRTDDKSLQRPVKRE
eukprot:TRINITY_DN18406_c0_g1_i1.p3 TRINITY_DN18406_c0_g1~~TRINITY_DN18406_c0_g1_i1.p3  ORF type:complete len:188 (-),score=71.45 TRINITY_DN18406_c0_g1_i1:47-610(-)